MKDIRTGISFDEIRGNINAIAKTNPKLYQIFTGLHMIDVHIRDMVINEIQSRIEDPNTLFFRTELNENFYSILIFSMERNATAGASWIISDFLEKCNSFRIENEVAVNVAKMLLVFQKTDIDTENINWVL